MDFMTCTFCRAPLIAVCQLLQEFLSETLPEDKKDVEHSNLVLSTLSDEAVFALQLFKRWSVLVLFLMVKSYSSIFTLSFEGAYEMSN